MLEVEIVESVVGGVASGKLGREIGKIAIRACSCTDYKKAAEVAECINPTTQPHAAL
jgi:hypothetical protein